MMISPAIDRLTELALMEDLAYGDITTESLFSNDQRAKANIVCHQSAIISGLTMAQTVFAKTDPDIQCSHFVQDGDAVTSGTVVMCVEGPVSSLLKSERLALNFLQHLSGIATLTYQYAGAISGTQAKITHTRKTIPGLRSLEIQAVVHGGGSPHRSSLSHAVLIKDNHLKAFGTLKSAVERIRQSVGHTVRIEVECDTLSQVEEALAVGADIILLDNMDVTTLKEAVKMNQGKAILEASGGVNLKNVLDIAKAGVDIISTSQITLSAVAVDLGMDFL